MRTPETPGGLRFFSLHLCETDPPLAASAPRSSSALSASACIHTRHNTEIFGRQEYTQRSGEPRTPPTAPLCLQNNGQENGSRATFAERRCLHGSAGSAAATPTCSGVQINRKAADAWTDATLVYLTEGCWCESRQTNKLAIHKNAHVIQRRGAIGALS